MPESAPIISAATSSSSAVPAPSLRPAKTMGRADGQDDLADHAPPPRAEGDGGADQQRIGLAHARVGVDRHREEHAERDHRHLGRLADPEPEDQQRQQRDLGDRERWRR